MYLSRLRYFQLLISFATPSSKIRVLLCIQGRPGYGENLYISYNSPGTAPPVTTGWVNGVAAWYDEIANYNYANPGGGVSSTFSAESTIHYCTPAAHRIEMLEV